jgi:hypothetical protein
MIKSNENSYIFFDNAPKNLNLDLLGDNESYASIANLPSSSFTTFMMRNILNLVSVVNNINNYQVKNNNDYMIFKITKPKIAMITVAINKHYKNYVNDLIRTKEEYAKLHNYDFYLIENNYNQRLESIITKYLLIEEFLNKGYDYIFITSE